ncbi:MAG TPA: ABC transporter permease [Blastocatellia bacterium]|nr:ABC transporter permease [Blastocatellia bacterium]
MQTSTLIKNNLTYFKRANLAVILGVAAAVSVLAGALLVGDSVRGSLRELLLGRLGNTDQVITSENFFREQLAADLQARGQFASAFSAACPLIVLEGVVTHDESHRRASGVQVYGVDERFRKFHGQPLPGSDDALISEALAHELGGRAGDAIVLRLEKPSDIPAESLHGRKDDTGRTIRLRTGAVLPASGIGEFSLRPQQGSVKAVFVPLEKLQRELEQEGKVNTILLAAVNQADDVSARVALAERLLKESFALEDTGLKLRNLTWALSLERESNLITDEMAEIARRTATASGQGSHPVFSYVVNTIRHAGREIPYSLVAAVDSGFENNCGAGIESGDQIVLNDWAAQELQARCGDEIELDYFVWKETGGYETRTARFRLTDTRKIKPTDRDLIPAYRGITESDSISDWNPPFPVDLKRIRPQDEAYWKQYRTSPKAFIQIAKGQELWRSRFGSLTSMLIVPAQGENPEQARAAFASKLKAAIDPLRFGFMVLPARAEGMQAARGATDFGEYFLYFSFFIVVSALLLTGLFFKLGIEQRLNEIGLLRAVGFPATRIRSLFLIEGLALATTGSLLGLIGAIVYGWLMMFGLRTWWVGAVGTTRLTLHVAPFSLIAGLVGGVLTALLVIVLTLRKVTTESPRSLLAGKMASGQWSVVSGSSWWRRAVSARVLAMIFGAAGLLMLAAAIFKVIGQVAGFFGAGTLLLMAALFFWAAWLRGGRQMIRGSGWWPVALLGFRSATSRPGRSVLCIALIASAAFIIVAVDAFRRDSRAQFDQHSGTGGYPLLAQSLLPVIHNPNTPEGREELVLDATGDDALRGVTFARFRVRPGDDASCLNLYQPRKPRILAPGDDFIRSGRFAFQSALANSDAEKANPWLLLEKQMNDGTVPVIADANSLTYVLHRALNDVITINASDGSEARLRIVAALSDSVLQGELLMSERNFLRLFPDEQGWRFFLIDAPPQKAEAVTRLLEDKLSDYGFDVTSTAERLAGFHQVENTYLSTFQTLGGLGLLLGTVGLAAVLLRNVLERRRELALLRATGWQASHLTLMIVAENALLLGCGLLTGVVCALIAIAPAMFARGGQVSVVSLAVLLLAVLVTGLAASLVAVAATTRAPLLPALRTE